jgi:hypothetical protein
VLDRVDVQTVDNLACHALLGAADDPATMRAMRVLSDTPRATGSWHPL